MKHHPSWTALRSYAITAGLACLMGVSYELFVFPNSFAPAGINGLTTMIQYLFHINIGYLSLLINLPLVLLIALLLPGDFRLRLALPMLPLGALSLLLGMLVSAAMTTILTGTYFWTVSGQGINRFLPMIGAFLAGNILPLGLLPAGLREALRLLPFASMLDAPLRILIGAVDAGAALRVVGLQLFWLVVLAALGRAVVGAGARKCMVQGG